MLGAAVGQTSCVGTKAKNVVSGTESVPEVATPSEQSAPAQDRDQSIQVAPQQESPDIEPALSSRWKRDNPQSSEGIALVSAQSVIAPPVPPDPGAAGVAVPDVDGVAVPGEAAIAPPAEPGATLPAAPLEASDRPYPINLATALSLADARPLIVTAAQASAWVAEARLDRAKVLWVPEFDFGAVYMRHDGFGPDFNLGNNNPTYIPGKGGPLNQNLNWFYIGGSLWNEVHATDAIFEPLAARQVLDAERWSVQSAKNDALLATAEAYFTVHEARGTYTGLIDVVDRGHRLIERITELSEDLVPRVEVNRVKMMVSIIEQELATARQEWRVASADLTQVLRLDPGVVVEPLERDHLQVTLIDPSRNIDELTSIAILNRPELASQKSMIEAAEVRIRREKLRPFLPYVLLTGWQSPGAMRMQAGVFGTGRGHDLNNWSLRDDVSMQLIWQLEGFGLGNLARVKQQRGEESEAIVKLYMLQDSIAAEVTETQARVQAAAVRVMQTERALREAIITYDGNYEGLRQTRRFGNILVQVYRPQEAVKALQSLMAAYQDYFKTVAEYNRAQFALFHAMGYPALDLIGMQPTGDVMPVNTDRPFGLPLVDEGPPAANR